MCVSGGNQQNETAVALLRAPLRAGTRLHSENLVFSRYPVAFADDCICAHVCVHGHICACVPLGQLLYPLPLIPFSGGLDWNMHLHLLCHLQDFEFQAGRSISLPPGPHFPPPIRVSRQMTPQGSRDEISKFRYTGRRLPAPC